MNFAQLFAWDDETGEIAFALPEFRGALAFEMERGPWPAKASEPPPPKRPEVEQLMRHPNGYPMRALRVLATALEPLFASQVMDGMKSSKGGAYYGLKALMDDGLARELGGTRPRRYEITAKGVAIAKGLR